MGLWANTHPSKHRNEYTLGTDYMLEFICDPDVENTIMQTRKHSKQTNRNESNTHTHTNELHITRNAQKTKEWDNKYTDYK